MAILSSPIVRFCLVLTVLPTAGTFLFLRRQIQMANLCFVEEVYNESTTGGGQNDVLLVTGIYRQRSEGLSYLSREAPFANSWSSIAELGRVLAPPVRSDKDMLFSLLNAIADSTGRDKNDARLTLGGGNGRWCIEPGKICSSDQGERRRPSVGVYSNGTLALKVTCHDVDSIFIDGQSKAKKSGALKHLSSSEMQELDTDGSNFVTYRPASAVLMALMLFLAYRYYSQQQPAELVAFSYDSIVERWEFWRAFTGSTAHFMPVHLATNMYSLYTLGSELEESYGSIPFLLYNIALIPLTVIMTLLFIKMMGSEQRRRQLVVGYSGVLFAWSTVADLRLPIAWPFQFGEITKNFYFKTIEVGPIKLNASPFIRMGVIHLLVPSTCWEGHLAGIMCGLAMQCSCLPLSLVQPAVLIPSILWLHFYAERNVISFDCIEQVILKGQDSRAIQEHRRVRRVCELIRNMLVPVGLLGYKLFEWTISLQLALVLLFLQACIMNLVENVPRALRNGGGDWAERHCKNQRSIMLWKAFLLTCFLSVLSDSMTFGGWMSCNAFWFSDQYTPLQFWFAGVFMILRIGLQTAMFAVAAKKFLDLEPASDIFFHLFYQYHLRDGATTGVALTEALGQILTPTSTISDCTRAPHPFKSNNHHNLSYIDRRMVAKAA